MRAGELIKLLHGVRSVRGGWIGCCPAHDDKTPSLSVNEGDDRVLLFCHAGCTLEQICAALKIEKSDLFFDKQQHTRTKISPAERIVARYDYTDENGKLLFQVVRYEPKGFRQRRPDGNGGWLWSLNGTRRVLYHLPEVLTAKDVLVVEGERDCETARAMGIVATCNAAGAGKWREEYSEHLRGKRVAIIADADEPGREHAQQVAVSLDGKGESVKVLQLPGAKDLSEWKSKYNFSRDALLDLIRNAPERKTAEEAPSQQAGVVLRCFNDIAPKSVRWLWPGRIPFGKITLVIGDPGLGKSHLSIDIISRLTRGEAFPDGAACESGSAIILSAEDDAGDTMRPRLDAAGADVSRVHNLEAVRVQLADGSLTEKDFSLVTDITALEVELRKDSTVRLIVIDPISAYLGNVNSHSNAEVRGALKRLDTLARRYGIAVLCVTHLRKSPGAAVYRGIGSIAFTAAARALWAVASDPEDADRRLLVMVKQNLSASIGGLAFRVVGEQGNVGNVSRLSWEPGAVALTANDVLNDMEQQDRGERREARAWLEDVLANGPVAVREIQKQAKAAGLSWITVRRAKDALSVVASKSAFHGGWEWRLEDAHPIHTQVSAFEQGIENKEVNLNNAAEDAHPAKMSTFGKTSAFGVLKDDQGGQRLENDGEVHL